ncbi:hypothetical protein SEVIR_2G280750v4 [Setaria viridis]
MASVVKLGSRFVFHGSARGTLAEHLRSDLSMAAAMKKGRLLPLQCQARALGDGGIGIGRASAAMGGQKKQIDEREMKRREDGWGPKRGKERGLDSGRFVEME